MIKHSSVSRYGSLVFALLASMGLLAGCASAPTDYADADDSVPATEVDQEELAALTAGDGALEATEQDDYSQFWVPGARQTVDADGNIVEYQEAVVTANSPVGVADPNHRADPYYYPMYRAQGWFVGPDGNLYPGSVGRYNRPVAAPAPQSAPLPAPSMTPATSRTPISPGFRTDSRRDPARGVSRDQRR